MTVKSSSSQERQDIYVVFSVVYASMHESNELLNLLFVCLADRNFLSMASSCSSVSNARLSPTLHGLP